MQEVSRLVQPVDKAELELGACAVPVTQSKNNPATSKTRRMSVSPGRCSEPAGKFLLHKNWRQSTPSSPYAYPFT